ncbi:helicase related [Anaeramoeba flamelloides]|uniref:Helicase related n=1 Tax=Anaeramoeba flamelloides TaxID=1746091 RepID=A0ABQ8XGK8_9EUKA|nr:helicase related [Anaeramoeba flamelloides]
MIIHKKLIRDYCSCFTLTIVFLVVSILSIAFVPGIVTPKDTSNKWADGEGKTKEGLFWFIHTSDTHCQESVKESVDNWKKVLKIAETVKPSFILNTGDLVEGCPDLEGTGLCYETKKDWELYRKILQEHNLLEKESVGEWNGQDAKAPYFLDIRGERDIYSVSEDSATENYYYPHSNLGGIIARSEKAQPSRVVNRFTYGFKFGTYEIITADFLESPIASFPYGIYNTPTSEHLDQFEAELINAQKSDPSAIIVATHYPLTTIVDLYRSTKTGKTFRELLQYYNVELFLVGHFHSTNWDSILLDDAEGVLELGASSIRFNSAFNMIVYDNGLLSWKQIHIDDLLDRQPIFLITNPPDARYLTSNQPLNKIVSSKYLRVSIFEDHLEEKYKAKKVSITIGDNKEVFELKKDGSSDPVLWVAKWDPMRYSSNDLYQLNIAIELQNGEVITQSQSFSTVGMQDGSSENPPALQAYVRANSFKFLLSMFCCLYFFLIIVLLIGTKIIKKFFFSPEKFRNFAKDVQNVIDDQKLTKVSLFKIFKYHITFNLWKYSLFEGAPFRIFLFSALSILILPVSVAPMMKPDKWGVSTIYGIYCNGGFHFEPNNLMISSFFLLFIYWPILNIISKRIVKNNIPRSVSEKKKLLILKPSLYLALLTLLLGMFAFVNLLIHYQVLGAVLSINIIWNALVLLIYLIITLIKDLKGHKDLKKNK